MPSVAVYDKQGKLLSDVNISLEDFAGCDCSCDSSYSDVSIDKEFNVSVHEYIKLTDCDSLGSKKGGKTHFKIINKKGSIGPQGVIWEPRKTKQSK